jgi:selenocysteine lyase/cysteine desulfurase
MHPNNPKAKLDAIYFSPHKFLGGPGTSGVLVMDKKLIDTTIPDMPGGGTVDFTNQWGDILYKKDLEEREDGGTPGFLQAIKTALAIKLKEEMGIANIEAREKELIEMMLFELEKIDGIHILDEYNKDRLGIISIKCEKIHYDLMVRLLDDRFGIQVRGGCSCAGPYGHYLLHIDEPKSKQLSKEIEKGIFTNKPGWVRISLHPTMSNEEVYKIIAAIKKILLNYKEWSKDYQYQQNRNLYKKVQKNDCAIHHFFQI